MDAQFRNDGAGNDQALLEDDDRPAGPTLSEMILRGAAGQCPACGGGRLFRGYLRVVEHCVGCKASLGQLRADDAPPYLTIFITAHITIALLVVVDRYATLPLWLVIAGFTLLAAAMSLLLLRPIKGMTVAVLLRLAASRTTE